MLSLKFSFRPQKKNWKNHDWQKEFCNQLNKKTYIANSTEAKKQLVKKHSSKNSNTTKTLLTNLQESVRQIFYKSFFEKHKNDSKKTWDGIRSIINVKENSKKQIKSIKINDKVESSPKILADSFNNFFVAITKNNDKNIHTNANYKDYLENSVTNLFFLKPTNEEKVN